MQWKLFFSNFFFLSFSSAQAIAGLLADGRAIVNHAKYEAKNYRDFYKVAIPPRIMSQRLALYVQAYTLYSSVRPFGVSTLMAGYDRNGPQLYMIEPSGVCYVRISSSSSSSFSKNLQFSKRKTGLLWLRDWQGKVGCQDRD